MRTVVAIVVWGIAFGLPAVAANAQPYRDETHPSKVFGEPRHYRLFLPTGYEQSAQRYPVVYYFHGHSDRYTLEKYDDGHDTVPKISAFVASHPVIVVAVDGYIASAYTGFYGGAPYDIMRDGATDFGAYFLELVQHIDGHYRTLTTRRSRATSGLSMGGFMSLLLSARYPELIGSASAFNPGPEFFAGEAGRRELWRPKDHVLNHGHTKVRLIRASGDYISQYHEETRFAYAIQPAVDFEFRQDEYHRHWATSIAETLDFHMNAFGDAQLDQAPALWSYDSPYRRFSAWGYQVKTDANGPAYLQLENVSASALRVRTRQWAPDGPPASCTAVDLITAPLYRANETYTVRDLSLMTQRVADTQQKADADGRLTLRTGCEGHQLSIQGPGLPAPSPILLPFTSSDVVRVIAAEPVALPVRVWNPAPAAVQQVNVKVSTEYPTVLLKATSATVPEIAADAVADLGPQLSASFVAAPGDFAHARIQVALQSSSSSTTAAMDLAVASADLPTPQEITWLDGRTQTVSVFHQRGNQGGGEPVQRTVTEGKGNADGVPNPGEQGTLWLRMRQGLDPFDRGNWCRAKVYPRAAGLTEIADLQEQKQREWTGAQNRTSLLQIGDHVSSGTSIPVLLDCESWSFHFTPDVRYGREPLYQAYQFHQHQLFAWTLIVGRPIPRQGGN